MGGQGCKDISTNKIENSWSPQGPFDLLLKRTLSDPDKSISFFNRFNVGQTIVRGFDIIPNTETIKGEGANSVGIALKPNPDGTRTKFKFNRINYGEVTIKFANKDLSFNKCSIGKENQFNSNKNLKAQKNCKKKTKSKQSSVLNFQLPLS